MARPKKIDTDERTLTPRQERIRELTAKKRDGRSLDEQAELIELQAVERRERWNRIAPRRLKALGKAIDRVLAMSSPQSYQYTPEEAAFIATRLEERVRDLKRAFGGAPKEKGLYDL